MTVISDVSHNFIPRQEKDTTSGVWLFTQTQFFTCVSRCLTLIPLILLVGCATTASDLSNYSVRQFLTDQQENLLDTAEHVLIEQHYALYQRDDSMGRLRARTDAISNANTANSSRTRSRFGNTHRHAEIRVHSNLSHMTVYCKVLLQQRVTEAHRMLYRDYTGQDTPNDTPIDRDAATTEEQNTIWRIVRRDRRHEREILDAIEQAFKP